MIGLSERITIICAYTKGVIVNFLSLFYQGVNV